MAEKQREPGYYWVRYGGLTSWVIARWSPAVWWFAGSQVDYFDRDFDEIREQRIVLDATPPEVLGLGVIAKVRPE